MKRTRFWMLGAFVVVTALLVGAMLKVHYSPLYQLSRYPQTPAFKSYVSVVSQEMDMPTAGVNQAMLSIYNPADIDFGKVLNYQVSPNNQFDLHVINFAQSEDDSVFTASLSDAQSERIKTLMRQLPLSSPPAKRADLLVVLLYQRSNSQMRLYDRRNPPSQIREIARLLTQIEEKENRGLVPGSLLPFDLPHLRSDLGSSNPQNAVN